MLGFDLYKIQLYQDGVVNKYATRNILERSAVTVRQERKVEGIDKKMIGRVKGQISVLQNFCGISWSGVRLGVPTPLCHWQMSSIRFFACSDEGKICLQIIQLFTQVLSYLPTREWCVEYPEHNTE
jgi:hypothetical protein